MDGHLQRGQGGKEGTELALHLLPFFLAAPFPNLRRCRFRHQAEKSSESEEGAETGEEEEGEKEKEEKQKDVEEKAESSPEEDPKRHGFLILSREESTMVKKQQKKKTLDIQCLMLSFKKNREFKKCTDTNSSIEYRYRYQS